MTATEHGSVWLSLFMDSNGNAYYYPRRLAPGWAQLNIYTNKQYNLDPYQTMECIWRWTWNLECGIFRLLPFNVGMVSRKDGFVPNDKTIGGTKQNRILTGDLRI
jgi:hypothetical protein